MTSRAVTTVSVATLFLTLLCALSGCNSGPAPSFGIGNPMWSIGNSKPVPGLDQASVTCGTWGTGSAVIIWTDLPGGRSSYWPAPNGKGVVYEGHHSAPDGRRVDCRCETPDGRAGTVK